jgi:hypothetical protein
MKNARRSPRKSKVNTQSDVFTLKVRPPGYFEHCDTKAEIQEANKLAKASVVRAPTDLE